jgi:peptidoglycan/LPS O-acetylase OafA/YrhL
MKYRADIQVMRGIAVLAVVFYHAKQSVFPLGYLGVDSFFVISGFVVTPLILRIRTDEKLQGLPKGLLEFYKRRFYRLAPALGTTLGISAILVFLIGNLNDHLKFAKQGLATILLLGNFGAYQFSGDYFSPNPNPLIHTWSLSVEEQIYLILPIILIVFVRQKEKIENSSYRLYIYITSICFLVYITPSEFNFLFKILSLENTEQISFYSPISRFWQFTLGGIIFFLTRNISVVPFLRNKFLQISSSAVILVLLFMQLQLSPRTGSLLVSLATGLVIYSGSLNTFTFIAFNLFKWLGDRSYSIYLIHMPVLYFANHSTFTELQSESRKTILSFIAVAITLFLASISYNKVEQRYRHKNLRVEMPAPQRIKSKTKVLITFVIIPAILFGAMIPGSNNGYWGLVNNETPNWVVPALKERCPSIHEAPIECQTKIVNSRGSLLLVGDSHSMSFFKPISELARQESISLFVWWKVPSSSELNSWVRIHKPLAVIFSRNFHDSDGLAQYVTMLEDSQRTSNVLLVGQVPQWPDQTLFMNYSSVLATKFYKPAKSMSVENLDQEALAAGINLKKLSDGKAFEFLDPFDYFCELNICTRWSSSRGWLYFDWNHLSDAGASLLTSNFKKFIVKSIMVKSR